MSRTIFDDSHYLNLGALFSFKSISINKSQLRYVSNAILLLSLAKPICQLNCILITSHLNSSSSSSLGMSHVLGRQLLGQFGVL